MFTPIFSQESLFVSWFPSTILNLTPRGWGWPPSGPGAIRGEADGGQPHPYWLQYIRNALTKEGELASLALVQVAVRYIH